MITMLEAELLAHLDAQLASARRLLGLVLDQGKAIRVRDVDGVLGKLAEVQTEMGRRGSLGVPATEVTLERLCLLVTPGAADAARERSAELRGLLAEIAREHGINRALMRQELAFLSHLTRLVSSEAEPGYDPTGATGTPGGWGSNHHVLDLR